MESSAGPVYEARYGHTPRHVFVIEFGLVSSAVVLLLPAPAYTRAIVVAVFGGMAVMVAAVALSRNPAIRVDTEGVTVRPFPLRFRVIAFFPWEDVVQIRLLGREEYGDKYGYVELKLRDLAFKAMLNRLTRRRSVKSLLSVNVPGVGVNQWTLRPARLVAAVASFAPAVPVVGVTFSGSVMSTERPIPGDTGPLPALRVPLAHGWPGWVLAGAAAGLVAGVVLAVVGGQATGAASFWAGVLILLALAALFVAVPAALYRRFR